MNANANALTVHQGANIIPWNSDQMATMKRTLAKDANADEFDMFISYCVANKLDPIRGQAILVVYGRGDKRKATIITTQAGARSMADRTGGYHPAKPGDTQWTYTPYELKRRALLAQAADIFNVQERTARMDEINANMPLDPANPKGLLECRTVIYKNGEPVEGIAKWSEYAPLTPNPDCFDLKPTGQYWENKDGSQGREKMRKVVKSGINPAEHMILDTSGRWGMAGEGMLAKCANVNALKAAFPDHFDHRFETEETVEHLRVADVTASELAEMGEQERRENRIGKEKDEYAWTDATGNIKYFPAGDFGAQVMRTVRTCKYREDFEALMGTTLAEQSFNRFWAAHKADALDVKAEFEEIRDGLPRKPKPAAMVAAGEHDREITPAPAHA